MSTWGLNVYYRQRTGKTRDINGDMTAKNRYRVLSVARWDWPLVGMCLFVLALLVFRLAKAASFPFWDDEYHHVFAARSLADLGKPLLPGGRLYSRALPYTWLVSVSFRVLGVSEISARLVTVILGSLLVLLVFLLGRRYLGTATGVLAAVLVAVDPINAPVMLISRMYGMFALLFIITAFGLYESVRHAREGSLSAPHIILTMIAGLLALWTHVLAVFLAPGIIAYLAILGVKDVRSGKVRRGGVEIASAVALLLISMILYMLKGASGNEGPSLHDSSYWYFGALIAKNALPALLFSGLGLWAAVRRKNDFALFFGCLVVFALLTQSLLFPSWASPRYVAHILSLFYIVAAYGVGGFFNNRNAKVAAAALLIIFTFINAGRSQISDSYFGTPDYAALSRFIGSPIASTNPLASVYYLGGADYWLREQGYAYYTMSGPKGPFDGYSGALLVSDYAALNRVVSTRRSGWIVLDGRAGNLSKETMRIIRLKAVLVARDRRHLMVYRWELPSVSR